MLDFFPAQCCADCMSRRWYSRVKRCRSRTSPASPQDWLITIPCGLALRACPALTSCVSLSLSLAVSVSVSRFLSLSAGVALIQFLKAFTPMVVTLFSYILLRKSVSTAIWIALAVACAGTSMTAAGDMSLNMFGLLLAVGSSCTEAIRLVLTQFALQDCRFSLLEGQYFLAPAGAACLLLLSIVFEFPTIMEKGDFIKFHEHPLSFALAGCLGFGVQLLTSSVIKLTSSITVKVLSQLRNALVVLSGVFMFGEVVTGLQLLGYVVSVVGIMRYSLLQGGPSPPVRQQASGATEFKDAEYSQVDKQDQERRESN